MKRKMLWIGLAIFLVALAQVVCCEGGRKKPIVSPTSTSVVMPTITSTLAPISSPTRTPRLMDAPSPTPIPQWDRDDCIEDCMMIAECWYGHLCPEARAIHVEVQGAEQAVCDYNDAIELLDDERWDLYKGRVRAFRNVLCPKICDPNVSESDKPYNFVFCGEIK